MRLGLSSFLTLCLAVTYSLMVWLQQQAKLWDWLNTLAATGISFFLALVAGIYLFNQQTKANRKSSHDDLHTLLAAELSDLLRIFNDTSRMGLDFPSGRKIDVLITYVQPLVIEKAALSGLFSATESENLLHTARKIRTFNLKIDYFLGLLQSKASENTFMHAYENIEQTRQGIIDAIRHISGQLKLQLTENYPD